VKLPPYIVRPEELVKNDMQLVTCNLKGNLKIQRRASMRSNLKKTTCWNSPALQWGMHTLHSACFNLILSDLRIGLKCLIYSNTKTTAQPLF